MVSNDEIRIYLKKRHGFEPKNGWIAHAKDVYGIPLKGKRQSVGERKWKCPKKRLEQIKDAFVYFKMLNQFSNSEM
jgi:hypothetical protein